MIEVQLILCATLYAASTISLPHFALYIGRNDSAAYRGLRHRSAEVFFPFNCHKFELEHGPMVVPFAPGIDKVEDPVVRPNAWSQFFVYPDAFGRAPIIPRGLSGFVKSSVLRQGS
jgi:hypothetical protein